jgi:hypothetical protein
MVRCFAVDRVANHRWGLRKMERHRPHDLRIEPAIGEVPATEDEIISDDAIDRIRGGLKYWNYNSTANCSFHGPQAPGKPAPGPSAPK